MEVDKVADKVADMVDDKKMWPTWTEVDKVADRVADLVTDMEVDKVTDIVAAKKIFTLTSTSTWKSNLVREMVTGVG